METYPDAFSDKGREQTVILDHIANRRWYYGLGEDFRRALDFFAQIGSTPFEKANSPLPGAQVLVKARPMLTKPAERCAFESHRRYADVHFVAYGEERIGYAELKMMRETAYDEEKDTATLSGTGDTALLREGWFMITFPQDAHMPCIAPDEPQPLGKMIAKIRVK